MGFGYEPGRRVIGTAVTTPASIDASTALTVPSAAVVGGGLLECTITIEGTVTARYTVNGTTPTSAVGHLLPAPTATVPVTILLRGRAMIDAFKIIGTASGDSISYFFAIIDNR